MVETSSKAVILLTGSTGYIGSTILKHLLAHEKVSAEFRIRCAVRDPSNEEKLQPLRSYFGEEAMSSIEFFKFDLQDAESIDRAVEGCTYVIHCAAPVTAANPKDKSVLVKPAVEGTQSIMRASQKHQVSRVVLTSSIAALYDFQKGQMPSVIDESVWSDEAAPSITAYNMAKLKAEKSAWEFIEAIQDGEYKPELVTILPGWVLGEPIAMGHEASVSIIKGIMRGRVSTLPKIMIQAVDILDVAEAHVRSLFVENAAGKRFIVKNKGMWLSDVARVLHSEFDGKVSKQHNYSIGISEYSYATFWLASWFNSTAASIYPYWNVEHNMSNQRSKDVLGLEYARDMHEVIIESAFSFINSGKVTDKPKA